MDRPTVLLVDDNPRIRSFVRLALEDAGFDCAEATDGWSALNAVVEERPDIVVLDIMLGDDEMSGLDVCKELRKRGFRTPVVFLTIKDRRDDARYLERAFQLGADDYVTKREELRQIEVRMGLAPTEVLGQKSDTEELIARIRARLNLIEPAQQFDDYLSIDAARHLVRIKRDGEWQDVRLTAAEYELLFTLARARGRPVGKSHLMDVAGIEGEGSLQTHIWRLRAKIEPAPDDPRYVVTFHSVGYRFRREPGTGAE